jgi:endoglucanase
MSKKALCMILCLALVFSISLPVPGSVLAEDDPYLPPGGEDWNKLQDMAIFDEPNSISGWNFGLEWQLSWEETHEGKPSLQITTQDEAWGGFLEINGWQTADLFDYYENGTIEFNIKGAEGGENFRVGFRDNVTERVHNGEFIGKDEGNSETSYSSTAAVSDYIEVTTQWQHVAIPLRDFIELSDIFDITKVQLFEISQHHQEPYTVYLNQIRLVSPDAERSRPPIKVNQVGYFQVSEKYALVSGYYNELTADVGTPFQVRDADSDEVVYTGELTLVAAYDPASGEKVFNADFSDLEVSGSYYVTVTGVNEPSPVFKIGNDIYDDFLVDVQRFYYYQRANTALLEEHAGQYARDALHMEDENLPLSTDHSITKDVSGGWFDAGDNGKYVTAAATAVSELLWTYEMFPHVFYDGQLNIPESGDGIPDLINEIKFETDFLLKMQDEESGGFYSYVNRDNAPNRFIQHREDGLFPTEHTANTAGALAHAYIIFREIPGLGAYAETLLAAAEKGWEYLEQHPDVITPPNGPYYTDDDKFGRFYLAGVLYRATGKQKYDDYFLRHYTDTDFAQRFEDATSSHGINGMAMMSYMHYLSADTYAQEVMDWFEPRFRQYRTHLIEISTTEAVWRNTTNNFYWGANTNVLNVNLTSMLGSRIIDDIDPDIYIVAKANLNYILGINPLQLSYVTGYGENRVIETISTIFNQDWIVGLPSGFMPGGANGWNNSIISQFHGKAYNHSTRDWVSNEHAINYNAPLVFAAAFMVDQAQVQERNSCWEGKRRIPPGIDKKCNNPNKECLPCPGPKDKAKDKKQR